MTYRFIQVIVRVIKGEGNDVLVRDGVVARRWKWHLLRLGDFAGLQRRYGASEGVEARAFAV